MLSLPARFLLFSFKTSDDASLALDKVKTLEKARLLPLPPEIDAGCGFVLRILYEDLDLALDLMKDIPYEDIYILDKSGSDRDIEKYRQ